jgi:hypothetical protein
MKGFRLLVLLAGILALMPIQAVEVKSEGVEIKGDKFSLKLGDEADGGKDRGKGAKPSENAAHDGCPPGQKKKGNCD